MKESRILVTGGAGFIGSHLVEALLRKGYAVNVLDNLCMGKLENIPPEACFCQGDILNDSDVAQALEGVDAVVHLAARVAIRDSVAHFHEDAQTNLMGTLRLLHHCAKRKLRKFVFASSMAVYRDSQDPKPISESYLQEPISPYGLSKLAAEKYVGLLSRQLDLPSVCLRYFNTYGPRQAFTPYVGDIARATVLALESEVGGETLNVGTGIGTSVRQVAELLIRKLRPGLEPRFAPPQPGEIRHSVADISRIRSLLGFRPEGQLSEKIDEVIAWNQAAGADAS